jgi:hypothetical protein
VIGLIMGAVTGLCFAIPGAPFGLSIPGRVVSTILTRLTVTAPVVHEWVAPIVGWAATGSFIGWVCDVRAGDRRDD